jgi:glycolate oxidase
LLYGQQRREQPGGPHTLAYGVTTNHVLGVEVVLDDGQILNSAAKFRTRPARSLGVLSAPGGPWALSRELPCA